MPMRWRWRRQPTASRPPSQPKWKLKKAEGQKLMFRPPVKHRAENPWTSSYWRCSGRRGKCPGRVRLRVTATWASMSARMTGAITSTRRSASRLTGWGSPVTGRTPPDRQRPERLLRFRLRDQVKLPHKTKTRKLWFEVRVSRECRKNSICIYWTIIFSSY